jgi:murein DD-endopeptidase MepM/ murein hydrolase activator NlpD
MRRKLIISFFLLITLAVLTIGPILINQYLNSLSVVTQTVLPPPEEHFEYGICVDSLRIEKGFVRKNQSLSDILSFYNIPKEKIHYIATSSKAVFDVRRLRAGNPYTVMFPKDVNAPMLYFIYEEDPVNYVTYKMTDPILVTRAAKPVLKDTTISSGVIESSLWNALEDEGVDPNLANEMSEVYAWTIDFFGIQKGDYFKVMYEKMSVEGEPIGIGKVISAVFHHGGKDLYAFRFEKNGDAGYYDEKAQNLQRAFLKAPLRFKRISSGFSHGRMHPILKIRRPHLGVDYAADYGTPVQTIGEGTVIDKGWDKKGGGNYVKIRHNGTYTTLYMHLQGFARGLKTGTRVSQGEVIGYVGSTGLSTGPHLDFRVFRNGQAIDPLSMESPPAEPVAKEYLEEYFQMTGHLKPDLDSVSIVTFSRPSAGVSK